MASLPEKFGKSNSVFRRFSRWKEKGVFSRYDELADAYLSFIHIAATLIWLK